MDKQQIERAKRLETESEEVSNIEWTLVETTEQEVDLIYRMYRLVVDRWSLTAGRLPGRKAEEMERFWIVKHSEVFTTWREAKGKGQA